MKLNQDCVRSVLLELEESLTLTDDLYLGQIKQLKCTDSYGYEAVIYSIFKLMEANYLVGNKQFASNELFHLSVSSLTWEGHLFLDTIRDNRVWRETKSIASRFSSVSISMLSNVASGIMNELIKKQLGS